MAKKTNSPAAAETVTAPELTVDTTAPSSSSTDAIPAADAEQRLPANPEQVGSTTPGPVVDPGATDPTPSASSSEAAASAFAVTKVNLAGVYFEPGAELPADAVAQAGEAAIAALLEAGAIRLA